MLLKIDRHSQKCVIAGDFNINLLTEDSSSIQYINMIRSSGLVPLISHPTRYSKNASTLIDHVYTNISTCLIKPYVLPYQIDNTLYMLLIDLYEYEY